MDEVTRQFIENAELRDLHARLSATHRPVKADVPEEHLRALGLLTVRFQRLELNLRQLCAALYGLTAVGQRRVLGELPFGRLIKCTRAAAADLPDHLGADVVLLCKLAGLAEQARNRLVHSVWTSGPRMKLAKGEFRFEQFEPGELLSVVGAIDWLDTCADALCWEVMSPDPAGYGSR